MTLSQTETSLSIQLQGRPYTLGTMGILNYRVGILSVAWMDIWTELEKSSWQPASKKTVIVSCPPPSRQLRQADPSFWTLL